MSKKPTAQKEFNLGLTPNGFLILKFTTNEAGFPVTRLEYDSGEIIAAFSDCYELLIDEFSFTESGEWLWSGLPEKEKIKAAKLISSSGAMCYSLALTWSIARDFETDTTSKLLAGDTAKALLKKGNELQMQTASMVESLFQKSTKKRAENLWKKQVRSAGRTIKGLIMQYGRIADHTTKDEEDNDGNY